MEICTIEQFLLNLRMIALQRLCPAMPLAESGDAFHDGLGNKFYKLFRRLAFQF
jgi:hypothetical protein